MVMELCRGGELLDVIMYVATPLICMPLGVDADGLTGMCSVL